MKHSTYFDVQFLTVEGYHVINDKQLFKIENAGIEELGVYSLKIKSFYGLASKIESSLKENPAYFEDMELYVLFSKDNLTFQAVKLKSAKPVENSPHREFVIEATVEVPSEHQKRVIRYLEEKAHHDAMYERLTGKVEKIVEDHVAER